MDQLTGSLRRALFGIDARETTFARRGFHAGRQEAVVQLERAGASFVEGYHAALDDPEPARLAGSLERVEPGWRGFAFEGAGMALALLDRLSPWNRRRLERFLAGPGDDHAYMVTIGAGWAWARLGSLLAPVERELGRLDPVLGWLALDGFGFHEGYFRTTRAVERQQRLRGVGGVAARAFDAGLGRSLWFVCGADPARVAAQIERFGVERRPDLWAGVGLACSYACGVARADIDDLVRLAGPQRPALAQGAAFAAKARVRAGNSVPHVESAVASICATSHELAAKLCDTELAGLAARDDEPGGLPAFERWRLGIRDSFARSFEAGEA